MIDLCWREAMRIVTPTLIALALAAAAAVPARADTEVRGHGWGHGVGLSQYGAYGYAFLEGRDHAWILQHYYPGTALDRDGRGQVRVLLKRTRRPALCGVTRLRDARGRRLRLDDAHVYRFTEHGDAKLDVTDRTTG